MWVVFIQAVEGLNIKKANSLMSKGKLLTPDYTSLDISLFLLSQEMEKPDLLTSPICQILDYTIPWTSLDL